MALFTVNLPNLTIPNAASTSNVIPITDDIYALSLMGPAALTGTVTVQVEMSSSGTNFNNLVSAGSNVTIGAAQAIVISPFPFKQFRLTSGSAEGAARTFLANKTLIT